MDVTVVVPKRASREATVYVRSGEEEEEEEEEDEDEEEEEEFYLGSEQCRLPRAWRPSRTVVKMCCIWM